MPRAKNIDEAKSKKLPYGKSVGFSVAPALYGHRTVQQPLSDLTCNALAQLGTHTLKNTRPTNRGSTEREEELFHAGTRNCRESIERVTLDTIEDAKNNLPLFNKTIDIHSGNSF